jgi:hypothetical protein
MQQPKKRQRRQLARCEAGRSRGWLNVQRPGVLRPRPRGSQDREHAFGSACACWRADRPSCSKAVPAWCTGQLPGATAKTPGRAAAAAAKLQEWARRLLLSVVTPNPMELPCILLSLAMTANGLRSESREFGTLTLKVTFGPNLAVFLLSASVVGMYCCH